MIIEDPENQAKFYLKSLLRKFGTSERYSGYRTLTCKVCGELRGSHSSFPAAVRCPKDLIAKRFTSILECDKEDIEPLCYPNSEYTSIISIDSLSGKMSLIPVLIKNRKELS